MAENNISFFSTSHCLRFFFSGQKVYFYLRPESYKNLDFNQRMHEICISQLSGKWKTPEKVLFIFCAGRGNRN